MFSLSLVAENLKYWKDILLLHDQGIPNKKATAIGTSSDPTYLASRTKPLNSAPRHMFCASSSSLNPEVFNHYAKW